MNKENLEQISIMLRKELSNSMKEFGTDWYHRLADIINRLDVLIRILDDPEKHEKLNKLCDPDKHG